MRAMVCHALTAAPDALTLVESPDPIPGPGEVRVRIKAASVNFPDLLMVKGGYQFKPALPFAPGMEAAGVIDAMGDGVTRFELGDRVIVGHKSGCFADVIVVPEAAVRFIPGAMDYVHAAALTTAYLTAYVGLIRCGQLSKGQTLLVHGAAGGVGLAAADLGRVLGATVIATGSSDEKLKVVKDRGADTVLNVRYGFKDTVKQLTQGRGADVIYDPVGGDVFDESVRCIAFGGRLLVIGFASGRIPTVDVNMPLIKGFSVVGVRAGEYGRQFPDRGKENIAAIDRMAADGTIKPYVSALFPLEQANDAMGLLRDRGVVGKAVITM